MARTPPAPKKPTGKAPAKLRGGWYPVSLLLPPDLVPEIDAIAAGESRSRAKMIEYVLRQFVQSYRSGRAADADPLAKHLAPPSPRARAIRGGRAA